MDANMHNWHTEQMLDLKMREINREVEANRLIKVAGLAKPGLLERIGISLGNTLVKIGQNLRERRMLQCQAYQETSSNLAS
ncbi:MAG: hypothetical protein PVJ21_18580 [Anaerolineales bacterium]|jgi:hypothetical protein